jgi:hypothetical protein
MKTPKKICPICGKAGKRGSGYCSERHKAQYARQTMQNPKQCSNCRTFYESEDFIGQQGQSVKCCASCRAHSKDIRARYKVRMSRLKKKPNQYQRQLYSLESCPWESGDVCQMPFGGMM